jgi:hypothetical protein
MGTLETGPRLPSRGIEVVRDGHVIFSFGYEGPGPVLECMEWLGAAMRGTLVRTGSLDGVSAKLLAHAGVKGVECGEATWGAMAASRAAGVEIWTDRILRGTDPGPLSALDGVEDPKAVYDSMVGSPALRALGWGTREDGPDRTLSSSRHAWPR